MLRGISWTNTLDGSAAKTGHSITTDRAFSVHFGTNYVKKSKSSTEAQPEMDEADTPPPSCAGVLVVEISGHYGKGIARDEEAGRARGCLASVYPIVPKV